MDYEKLKKGLSSQKLDSYTRHLNCNSDKELIAAYMVLQSIQEMFYLPMQLVEITLRNHINDAVKEHVLNRGMTIKQSNRWYNHIPQGKISQAQVRKAIQKADREISNRGANHNDVVAQLTFGFWVYLLDTPHRLTKTQHQLWPFITDKVFPNRKNKGIPALFNDLNTLNKLRNRLFHHEPIWSGSGVNSKQKALDKLQSKHNLIIKVLGYMSEDKLLLVKNINMINQFKSACSLKRFKDYEDMLP